MSEDAKMTGMTPAVLIRSGMGVDCPPYTRRPRAAPAGGGKSRAPGRPPHAPNPVRDALGRARREPDRAVTRVLRDLLPTRLALLGEPLERRNDDGEELQDDRGGDVRHDPERKDRQPPEVAAREEVDHAEQRALHLVEELGERVTVDARRRDVGADPVGDQHRRREQDAALQLGDLEDVLKALEAFDHEAATCAPSTSTRPPFASIFARADALTACAFTVRACATSPVPRIFTRARSRPLMSPAWARASGSTTAFAAKPPRAPRFTMAYGLLPPYGRNPRLGSRR